MNVCVEYNEAEVEAAAGMKSALEVETLADGPKPNPPNTGGGGGGGGVKKVFAVLAVVANRLEAGAAELTKPKFNVGA